MNSTNRKYMKKNRKKIKHIETKLEKAKEKYCKGTEERILAATLHATLENRYHSTYLILPVQVCLFFLSLFFLSLFFGTTIQKEKITGNDFSNFMRFIQLAFPYSRDFFHLFIFLFYFIIIIIIFL